MKSKLAVGALVAASFGYLLIALDRAVRFQSEGNAVGLVFAGAILALVGISGFLILRELQFGRQMQQVLAAAEADGLSLAIELPLAPSGKPDRDAADAAFKELLESFGGEPNTWQEWLQVALAYDAARDRKRARFAMRTSIAIYQATNPK